MGFRRWIDHKQMFSPVRNFQKPKKKKSFIVHSLRRFLIGTNIFNTVRIFFKTNRLDSFIISRQSDWNFFLELADSGTNVVTNFYVFYERLADRSLHCFNDTIEI